MIRFPAVCAQARKKARSVTASVDGLFVMLNLFQHLLSGKERFRKKKKITISHQKKKKIKMRQQINYQDLAFLNEDIERQMSYSPAFSLFNRDKIHQFKNSTKLRSQVLTDEIKYLEDVYVKKDEEGKPMLQKNEETKTEEYLYDSEEQRAAHKKELNDFLSITFQINF